MAETRGSTLNELLSILHDKMRSFAIGMERILDSNMMVAEGEIKDLIGRISKRLNSGQESAENKRIIELLNLLSKDQYILKIIKEDADEWLKMLDAIEKHIAQKGPLTNAEKAEINKINRLSKEMRVLIRK